MRASLLMHAPRGLAVAALAWGSGCSGGGDGTPLIESVAPSWGPSAGGTSVEIRGTGLGQTQHIEFGPRVAVLGHVSGDLVEVSVPGGLPGWVDVTLRVDTGAATTLAAGFGFDVGTGKARFLDDTAGRVPPDAWTLQDVAAGDVDGDGDTDFVVAGYFGSQDRLLRNDAGILQDVTADAMPPDDSQDVHPELGDLDGDGDLDLYMAAEGADRILMNDGAGVFSDETSARLPASLDMSEGADFGDIDGDGDLDVVVANLGTGERERLLLNDGEGRFDDVTALRLPDVPDPSYTSEFADLDGDGDIDLTIGNYGAPSRVLLNDGAGAFQDGAPLPGTAGLTTALVAGDVDADGDVDLYEARFMGVDRLLLNGGDATFTDASARVPSVDGDSYDAKFADLDGDRDLDIVVARTGYSNLVLVNDGAGEFVLADNLPSGDDRCYGIGIGDVDGNGALDLLFSSWGGDQTLLWINGEPSSGDAPLQVQRVSPIEGPATGGNLLDIRGRGFTAAVAVEVGGQPLGSLELVDATWIRGTAPPGVEGPADVVVRPQTGDAVSLAGGYTYRVPDAGPFTDETEGRFPEDAGSSTDVRLTDLTGDGLVDAFIARDGDRDRLFVGGGDGSFADETEARLPDDVGATASVELADVDADGDVDIVLARETGVSVWTNDAGIFSSAAVFAAASAATAVVVADLLEDGRPDIFVVRDGEPDVVLVGTAAGWEVRSTEIPAGAGTDARVADFDGDGHSDVLVVRFAELDVLLLGDGEAGFVQMDLPDDPALLSYAAAVGDVDGDGLTDIVVGVGGATSRNRLWRNTGGAFVDATEATLPYVIYGTSDILLVDLDADEDLDLLEINWWGPNWTYTNDGLGVFSAWTALPEIGDAPSVAGDVADLNADGFVDVVVAAAGERTRIFLGGGGQ